MAGYNLDEKTGLFGGFGAIKSPTKILNKGDNIEFKHSTILESIKAIVLDVTETTIRIQIPNKTPELNISPNDYIVAFANLSGEKYVICGDAISIDRNDPLEVSVKTARIEKIKDSVKSQRFFVCYGAAIKIIGVQNIIPAVIKALSVSAVKLNCKEEIMMEDVVDVTAKTDKINKITFKARVVRKNKLNNCNEYGLEITEQPESSSKVLHQIISRFEFGY